MVMAFKIQLQHYRSADRKCCAPEFSEEVLSALCTFLVQYIYTAPTFHNLLSRPGLYFKDTHCIQKSAAAKQFYGKIHRIYFSVHSSLKPTYTGQFAQGAGQWARTANLAHALSKKLTLCLLMGACVEMPGQWSVLTALAKSMLPLWGSG